MLLRSVSSVRRSPHHLRSASYLTFSHYSPQLRLLFSKPPSHSGLDLEGSDTIAVPLNDGIQTEVTSQSSLTSFCRRFTHLTFGDLKPEGFGNFTKKKKSSSKSSKTPSKPKPKPKPSTDSTPKKGETLTEKLKEAVEKGAIEDPEKEKSKSDDSDSGDGNEQKGGRKMPDPRMFTPLPMWVFLSSAAAALLLFGPDFTLKSGQNQISFQQFKTHMLESGRVEHVEVINKSIARVYLHSGDEDPDTFSTSMVDDDRDYSSTNGSGKNNAGFYNKDKVYEFNIGSVQSFEEKLEHAQTDMGIDSKDWVPIQYIDEVSVRESLFHLVTSGPILTLLIGIFIWRSLRKNAPNMFGGGNGGQGGMGGGPGGLFGVTKANFKLLNKGERVKTRFRDVAGLDNAKEEVFELVKFLKDPERFQRLGARIPKGALLVGPPGTGKTLLARAVAGEAECPFFSISGSDFVEMFVGVGASRVRNLFEEARKNAPCIVFIDEIDAVGRKRSKGGFAGGNEERENTLNQLLVEMDGFKSDTNIVVLAGTNRHDILDSALLRPGRFDRQVQIEKPDLNGRVAIFKVHLRKLKLKESMDDVAQRMATLTPGTSGADIANVCNEAALRAARREAEHVSIRDFYSANDRILAGLEKKTVMTPAEKSLIAHHEAGHAVVGWFLEFADPLLKVTVIPRASGALGFAQYLPKELSLYTAAQLGDMMRMALGGRAAEQVFFGRVSTGAADDLGKVTKLAYGQISVYGMNDEIGNLSFPPEDNGGGGIQTFKPYSEKLAQTMDSEAQKMVKRAYEETLALVTEKRALIGGVAKALLEKETLAHDDLVELLGARPFESDAYKDFLENTREFEERHPGAFDVDGKPIEGFVEPEVSEDVYYDEDDEGKNIQEITDRRRAFNQRLREKQAAKEKEDAESAEAESAEAEESADALPEEVETEEAKTEEATESTKP